MFRKGSIKVIGEIKSHSEEVKRKRGGGTEVKINITDLEGEGEVVLSIWGPHKKTKDITVQINSKKGSDKRFVKLFADVSVREIIERLSTGKQIKELFEKNVAKVACTICSKIFMRDTTLNVHMKSHLQCNKCGLGFKKESSQESHKSSVHNSKPEKTVLADILSDGNKTICEDCGYLAPSRKSLMVHSEKEHIGDSWLVNTKREQNMMDSENESKKTRTEELKLKKIKQTDVASEEKRKQLSDIIDAKILLKRKFEDERDLMWPKEKENGLKITKEKKKQCEIKERANKETLHQPYKSTDTQNPVKAITDEVDKYEN